MLQTQVIPIGNSLGIRLPKSVLANFEMVRDTPVHIMIGFDQIILKPIKSAPKSEPRAHWAAAFSADPAVEVDNLWGDLPVDESWDA